MKKNISVLLYALVAMLLLASCEKDDYSSIYQGGNVGLTKDDPAETVIINIMNTGTQYPLGDNATLSMRDNNFYGESDGYNSSLSLNTIGAVSGLNGITSIPNGMEWAKEVAVIPGYGYVIKITTRSYTYGEYGENGVTYSDKYIRFYVADWITSSASSPAETTNTTGQNTTQTSGGGIIGAVIKYQLNWTPQ